MPTPPPSPRPRSRRRRIGDAALARLFALPRATSDFTTTVDLPIPTRDGAVLLADHLAPVGPARGTVLVRGPYGFDAIGSLVYGGLFARYGYHVVLARTRGTFGSGDVLEPFQREIDDAADTVEWLRGQPFFEGRFATFGGSYLGFTQWALLMDPPPELATALLQSPPHDFSRVAHGHGAFNLDTCLTWSDAITRQGQHSVLGTVARAAGDERRRARAMSTLPVASAADDLCQGQAPWFREWATRRDLSDPFWSRTRMTPALDRSRVPVLLQTGWHDLFLHQTLDQYARMRDRGVDVGLTVGPWNHQDAARRGYGTLIPEALDWLARHLTDDAPHLRPAAPVRITVAGTDGWRALPAWPPPASMETWHLQPQGALGLQPAPAGAPAATFTYDPTDPTPTVGGRILADKVSGAQDDSALAERTDVVVFTGPPLTAPAEVIGTPVVELRHRSDNPHADLFIRISEVDPQGRSRNVSDGFTRLDAASAGGTVRLELDAVAHRFAAGSRLRLLVAGGSFPRFERNLGTDQDPATSTATAPSRRTLDLDGSWVQLPRPTEVPTAGPATTRPAARRRAVPLGQVLRGLRLLPRSVQQAVLGRIAAGDLPPVADLVTMLEISGGLPDTGPTDQQLFAQHPHLRAVSVTEPVVPGPAGPVPARLYRLPGAEASAALVWVHGGAFLFGDLDMAEAHWVGLALAARGIPVLSLDYRKSLHGVTAPAASDDVLAGWSWATAHLDEFGVRAGQLHLGGASAGGNLAAGVAKRLRDGAGELPASLVLAYPLLHAELPAIAPADLAAIRASGAVFFDPAWIRDVAHHHAADQLTDPYVYPANGDLTGLPPTVVLSCEDDTLRSSAEAFAADLEAVGGTVTLHRQPDTGHGNLGDPGPAGQRGLERVVAWLLADR